MKNHKQELGLLVGLNCALVPEAHGWIEWKMLELKQTKLRSLYSAGTVNAFFVNHHPATQRLANLHKVAFSVAPLEHEGIFETLKWLR